MPIIKDEVQVLRVFEQGNTSQVLVLLGRRLGQLRVLAKGARRQQRKGFEGGFDLLARGQMLAYPRRDETLWIFKEWDERRHPRGFGGSLERLDSASFLCELAEALTRETAGNEHEVAPAEHAALFEVLAESAAALEALPEGALYGPILLRFALRALDTVGLLPNLVRCSRCERGLLGGHRAIKRVRLDFEGLACPDCLADEALERLPGRGPAPWSQKKLLPLTRSMRDETAGTARCVWLSPEALGALDYVQRTGKEVKLSGPAALACARTLLLLVHTALERDLRTLRAAAREVLRLGPHEKQRQPVAQRQ